MPKVNIRCHILMELSACCCSPPFLQTTWLFARSIRRASPWSFTLYPRLRRCRHVGPSSELCHHPLQVSPRPRQSPLDRPANIYEWRFNDGTDPKCDFARVSFPDQLAPFGPRSGAGLARHHPIDLPRQGCCWGPEEAHPLCRVGVVPAVRVVGGGGGA